VDREAARTSLGLPPEGSAVGIVGRLVPIKGHEVFLEAARRVAERRADVTFVVVGDGELRATLEDRARRALGARVRFTGWVAALPELYAALDVVALSSLNEGTPVVLIEAAAAGLPVVATDVGGVRDVVVDGGTGYLVASGDAVALAERIDDLLGDRERARAIGAEARRRVRAAFSPTTTADAIAAVYAEILAARSRTLR
jgi:glycosyltransferase involved in cell wall biosynthesis